MTELIKGQSIIIDAHQWGGKVPSWDDVSKDIHLDKKKTKVNYKGKEVVVDIKIPLNTDQPVTVHPKNSNLLKKNEKISIDDLKYFRKEMKKIFEKDTEKRTQFVRQLLDAIKEYPLSKVEAEQALRKRYESVLKKILIAFGLTEAEVINDFWQIPTTKTVSTIVKDNMHYFKLSAGKDFIYIGETRKSKMNK